MNIYAVKSEYFMHILHKTRLFTPPQLRANSVLTPYFRLFCRDSSIRFHPPSPSRPFFTAPRAVPRLGRRGLPQPSTSYHRLKRRETHCRSVGFSQCGRRERDSNPRNGQAVHRISSPAQSVTLASLHACSHAFAGAKVRKKEKEKKRIKKKITEKTKKQLCNTVARLFPYLCSVKTRICNVTH